MSVVSCRTPVGGSHPPGGCHRRKKARTCVRALISNMAVRGGLTRFARRYSAHPWASPLRGQRRRCSKTLPAFLSGQPAYCVRGLSNWRCQLSNPGRGFSSPPAENIKEKSPYLRTGSHLEYGGEGGIDSLRSPLRGSPLAGSRSVQLAAPVVEPRSGILIPPGGGHMRKKSPYLRTSSS